MICFTLDANSINNIPGAIEIAPFIKYAPISLYEIFDTKEHIIPLNKNNMATRGSEYEDNESINVVHIIVNNIKTNEYENIFAPFFT